MTTLILTSPRIKDEAGSTAVADAQKALTANPFDKFYAPKDKKASDDAGTFGKWTAEACYWARYWLGFGKRGEQGYRRRKYDDELASYLNGTAALPRKYQRRRKRRLDKVATSPGKRALEFAKKQIGEHENPPGSNRCATTAWYGFIGAWCAMFVSRCYVMGAGLSWFRYAYNPTLYAVVRSGHAKMGFVSLEKAQPGDVVQLDLDNGTEPPDHCALFIRLEGQNVATLDGNWGDKVGYQKHSRSKVMDVIHVVD